MKNLYPDFSLPASVYEACQSKAMQRIRKIDMNCGLNYTRFPVFSSMEPYTRYEHSVAVAALIYHFTGDEIQSLAGLFHDISTPVFSHVVDFMKGDHMVQETTESPTVSFIQNDPVIMEILTRRSISLDQVSDYHQYPIADNDSPKLSCDRLEYTLGNMVNYGFVPSDTVTAFLQNLRIGKNEEGMEELQFQDPKTALHFAELALRCGKIYSGEEDRYAMETLALLLKNAVMSGILSETDLYTTEEQVIQKLEHSDLKQDWQQFCGLYKITEGSSKDGLNINAKRRYIDPYIQDQGRVSEVYIAFRNKAEQFVSESYDKWLKGISI